MRSFDDLIKKRKIVRKKLTDYGFKKFGENFIFSERLSVDKNFELRITISPKTAFYEVIDGDFNEEYALCYVENTEGAFVGAIKNEVNERLFDVVAKCTESEIFSEKQARAVAPYIKRKFGEDLEFLWQKFPTDAIARNKNNDKWYLVLMEVKAEKLGIDSKETVEVIDLRCEKGEAERLIDKRTIFPAYHMNKLSWFTVLLSGGMSDERLFSLIDKSREKSLGSKK